MSTTTPTNPPPNQTLWATNLPDKLRKPDLRRELYTLFTTHGVVLDVVALKTPTHRGNAHIVFRDVASATSAMRALNGFVFYGKPMRIFYAKGKSHKIAKLDGTFRIPTGAQPVGGVGGGAQGTGESSFVAVPGAEAGQGVAAGSKGDSAPTNAGGAPQVGEKRAREDEDEDDDAEMEMDEDDD